MLLRDWVHANGTLGIGINDTTKSGEKRQRQKDNVLQQFKMFSELKHGKNGAKIIMVDRTQNGAESIMADREQIIMTEQIHNCRDIIR